MNYGELQDLFKKRLNRRDVTQSLVEAFIKDAIQRAQRLLRSPGSEAASIITVGEAFDGLAIPGDYLKLISITVNDNELVRRDLGTCLKGAKNPGIPRFFARNRNQFLLAPRPVAGDEITIVYHADFSALSSLEDTNWLTEIAPDVIIDGALSDACDHFSDPRASTFEANFIKSITDLNMQASDDELTNAAQAPGFSLDFASEEGF